MKNAFANRCYSGLVIATTLLIVGQALQVEAQSQIYRPISVSGNYEVSDTLSEQDIPTGEGGFARDYHVRLEKGDQVAIDLLSDEFDPIVMLIAADGSTIAENDDGPDGTTNSLLFARITESGKYIVRVRSFGETGGGKFTLKITRLRSVDKSSQSSRVKKAGK